MNLFEDLVDVDTKSFFALGALFLLVSIGGLGRFLSLGLARRFDGSLRSSRGGFLLGSGRFGWHFFDGVFGRLGAEG